MRAAQRLPVKARDQVFLGVWSAHDLVAHLVGWDFANMDSVEDLRAGKSPRVYVYWTPNWVAFNARLVKHYKRDKWLETMQDARDSHAKLIAYLKQVPAADFERDFGVRSPGGRKITIAYHLQAEIDDEVKHLKQIQAWLSRDRE